MAFKTLLAAVGLVALPTSLFAAEADVVAVVSSAQVANQADRDATAARLDLQGRRLRQLRSLRAEGYASWLEVEQQQLVVDALEKQQEAQRALDDFLRELRQAVELIASQSTNAPPLSSDDAARPMLVSLPGSVRVVGWIQADDLAVEATGVRELGGRCVTAQSHASLRAAALQVAAREAQACGLLRAAELEVERGALRLPALRQLLREGHARGEEVRAAEQRLNESKQELEQLQQQFELLKRSHQELRASLGDADDPPRQVGCPPLTKLQSWPSAALLDVATVSHRIDLRRSYYAALAQGEQWQRKVALQQNRHRRLRDSACDSPDDEAPRTQDAERLRQALNTGFLRELRMLELDIRHGQARRQAAEERRMILAWEEQRFREQCLRQFVPAREFDVVVRQDVEANADGYATTPVLFPGALPPCCLTRRSYVESPGCATVDRVCALAFSDADIRMVQFAFGGVWGPRAYRPRVPRTSCFSATCDYRPWEPCYWRPTWTSYYAPACPTFFSKARACFGYERDRLLYGVRFRLPSYHDAYEFGIRRNNLPARCLPSLGRTPYYLPGSPTNYRACW